MLIVTLTMTTWLREYIYNNLNTYMINYLVNKRKYSVNTQFQIENHISGTAV